MPITRGGKPYMGQYATAAQRRRNAQSVRDVNTQYPGTYPDPSGQGSQSNIKPPPKVTPDLGFNPAFEEAYRGLDRQGAGAQSDTALQIQRIMDEVAGRTRELGGIQESSQEALRDRLASQGILRSGITTTEQGKIGQRFGQEIANVQSSGASRQEDVRRALAQMMQDIESRKASLKADQARAQSDAAQQAAMINSQNQAAYNMAQSQQPQAGPTGQYSMPGQNTGLGTGAGQSRLIPVTQGGKTSQMTLEQIQRLLSGGR